MSDGLLLREDMVRGVLCIVTVLAVSHRTAVLLN